jgi:DNA-binding beta-propeller fold protein YncE
MPLDAVLSPDRRTLYVKGTMGVAVFDTEGWRELQQLPYENENGSMHGIVAFDDDEGRTHVLVTGAHRTLLEARAAHEDGMLHWERRIALPAPAPAAGSSGSSAASGPADVHAAGIALAAGDAVAYVCLSRNNTLAEIDLRKGKLLRQIPVGVCPYDVALSPSGTIAYVSNFGGHRARLGERTEQSARTQVPVDGRGLGISGTISIIELRDKKSRPVELEVGLHPAQMQLSKDGGLLYVAAANSDEVDVVDTRERRICARIPVRPDEGLPFGSIPNALLLGNNDSTLYCANAGNNAVAVIALNATSAAAVASGSATPAAAKYSVAGKVTGFIPTGWFPGALAHDGKHLFIANVKGEGSLRLGPPGKPHNSHYLLGSVTRVDVPVAPADLSRMTGQVRADGRVPEALRAMERAAGGAKPVPVPRHWGEPSTIRHVVYVIKENRTYDQILGDLPRGNGDPRLCIFGREVSPNHHALAEQFALLDNYYCSGVNSADGHQWATQGIVTDYQIKGSGDNTRSYDFGTDVLCYAPTDFIWDAVLMAGLSFRNYGELDYPVITSGQSNWFEVYRDWESGRVAFKQSIELEVLRKYTATDYPGWIMDIPDVCRMKQFLQEFRRFEAQGQWQNLVIVYLPQDHTRGNDPDAPSPRAHVADNDLALGQLVEAISHSKFWKDTVIFVNEDDPQAGFDHVDGHRSMCLVIGPWVKRGVTVSHFYSQGSVLHTITRMLGLAPLNQGVAMAPTMEDCFADEPDLRPYTCLPNLVPLDEDNGKKIEIGAEQPQAGSQSPKLDFTRPDRNDDDAFNRLLWAAVHPQQAYPREFAGAHGKGLAALGLKLERGVREKDDDDDDDER